MRVHFSTLKLVSTKVSVVRAGTVRPYQNILVCAAKLEAVLFEKDSLQENLCLEPWVVDRGSAVKLDIS